MDLIYTNAAHEDVGVMHDYTFDLAFGSDENTFELVIDSNLNCCEADCLLYIEGTEYGGVINDIGIDTKLGEVTYYGDTWQGILDTKVFEPDAGENYLVVSGEANSVLAVLVKKMGLESLFKASADDSGLQILNYKMNRYVSGYKGIVKMLKTTGAKLKTIFADGFVVLSAEPIKDYSQDEQFDQDQIELKIRKKNRLPNHVICLGRGELSEREVIHIYADKEGNISETQVFIGFAEVTVVYENVNAQDSNELRQGGIDLLKSAWLPGEIDFDFDPDEGSYDIGDIVGAYELNTKTKVSTEISKKIVQIKKGSVSVSYSCSNVLNTSSGGESGGSHTVKADTLDGKSVSDLLLMMYPVGAVYISTVATSPADLFGGIWERIEDAFLLSAGDNYKAGETGGEATHKLTVDEMPSHSHTVQALNTNSEYSAGTGSIGTYTVQRESITASNTGGSAAHNNMPPYLAVYMWKRTA